MLCRNDEPATRHLIMGRRQRREICGAASFFSEKVCLVVHLHYDLHRAGYSRSPGFVADHFWRLLGHGLVEKNAEYGEMGSCPITAKLEPPFP